VPPSIRLPDDGLRVLLFQTVRELMFNVVKHAKTDKAVITAYEIDDEQGGLLAVEVKDEGCGFDPNALDTAEFRSGFGLARMRGRLGLFGGRLEIDSRPGAGARLTIFLPSARQPLAREAVEARA
jgi:signal transduction histidine kinase